VDSEVSSEDQGAPDATAAPEASMIEESALRAARSLEEPFPEIEAVIEELGPPEAQGSTLRKQWRYDARPLGNTHSCSTLDLLRGPRGQVVIDESVYTGSECKPIRRTTAQVEELKAAISGRRYEEAARLFEERLGKPDESGEPPFAAWRYRDEVGECRLLVVTKNLGSRAGQALFGADCQ
jgi:hypothetical protein